VIGWVIATGAPAMQWTPDRRPGFSNATPGRCICRQSGFGLRVPESTSKDQRETLTSCLNFTRIDEAGESQALRLRDREFRGVGSLHRRCCVLSQAPDDGDVVLCVNNLCVSPRPSS